MTMGSEAPDRQPQLSSIQLGRGVAATLVVLFHATGIMHLPKYWGTSAFGDVFAFGEAGVSYFFVLSGFIIYLIHRKDIGLGLQGDVAARFTLKRIIRIYPTYWIVLAGLVLSNIVLFALVPPHDLKTIVSNVTLAPLDLRHRAISGAYLAVAWTLFHEVVFYLVFGLLILSRRIGLVVATAWAGVCAIGLFMDMPFMFESVNLLFLFGIAACAAYRSNRVPTPFLLMVGGICAFLLLGMESNYRGILDDEVRHLGYGLAGAIAIVGACHLERNGKLGIGASGRLLGDASYSLYLIHFPLLSALAKVLVHFTWTRALPAEIIFVVMVVTCLAAGIIFHLVVERPLLSWMTTLIRKPAPAAPAAVASGP